MSLFQKKKSRPRGAGRKGSPGKRLYAIGDVHGCYQEMCALLELIENDHRSRPNKPCIIVFLGDLIDRGPESSKVLEHLRAAPPEFADVYYLKGNHEEMMLRTLTGEAHLIPDWLRHGGKSCAVSYGVDPSRLVESDVEVLEHLLLTHIPSEHLEFLGAFVDSISFGDYFLVHAGVRPGIELPKQAGRDLRWIRKEFLEVDDDFGAVIVHGHTVTDKIVRLPNRIGLDTGTYMSGVLSAVRLEDEDVEFLSVGPLEQST